MALPLYFSIQILRFQKLTKVMIPALKYHIFKPPKMHDLETQSASDPIGSPVYLQTRHLHS